MTFVRNTKQRVAIQSAFEDADRPLRPEEALELSRGEVPSLSLATVYRTINSLLEERALAIVDIPGQPPRYEVSGKHHHHHFLCRECEQMFEVEGCLGELKKLTPPGFTLEDHHITLYGLCLGCTP